MARTGEAVEELRRVERRRRFSAETLLLLAPLGAPVLEPNLPERSFLSADWFELISLKAINNQSVYLLTMTSLFS